MEITCAKTRSLHRLAADEEKSKPDYDPRDLTKIVGPGRLKEVAELSFTSNPALQAIPGPSRQTALAPTP